MRYRAQDVNGDYIFGSGDGEFLVNSPDAVAQAVSTRLRLFTGEWWLDTSEGLPLIGGVLGEHTRPIYDQVIKDRILGTEGVAAITEYASVLSGRSLTVQARLATIFGAANIALPLSFGGG